MDVAPIRTDRLELVSFTPAMMRAVVAGDDELIGELMGATLVGDLGDELRGFFEMRLADLDGNPSMQPWLGRAMVIDEERVGHRLVIGSVGFHGPPDHGGRAEVGYSIAPEYRRRALTTEAVRAMLDWAAREHGIRRFRASVAPDNVASLALIARFGFSQVGTHWDDVDGEELVFELDDWGSATPA